MQKLLIAVLLLLCAVEVLAARPAPYIASGAANPAQFNARIGGNARFFTGGTVSIADIQVAKEWKKCVVGAGYKTAGISRNSGGQLYTNYWRDPEGETAVCIRKSGEWVPAFLVKCGNPIKCLQKKCSCELIPTNGRHERDAMGGTQYVGELP
jgi:hypothetical protein